MECATSADGGARASGAVAGGGTVEGERRKGGTGEKFGGEGVRMGRQLEVRRGGRY